MLAGVLVLLGAIAVIALGSAETLTLVARSHQQELISRYDGMAADLAKSTLLTELQQSESQNVAGPIGLPLPAQNQYQALTAAALPATPLCDASAPCGYEASATYSLLSNTYTSAGTANGAPVYNLDGLAYERRFIVQSMVSVLDANGNVIHTRPHYFLVRVYDQIAADGTWSGASQLLGDQDTATVAIHDPNGDQNHVVTGAADNGGCPPGGGQGCDPGVVSAPDPTTLNGQSVCTDLNNYNSATCETNPQTPAPVALQPNSTTWNNPDATSNAGP